MIYGIQLLRFIAAALVVLTHSMGEFPQLTAYGWFGVDIFFVISGFIMSHITQNQKDAFFAKRLIRIVPQYWLFTVLLSVIALLAPNLLRSARFDPLHILCSLFFIPHWTESTGFSPIVKLGWTLNFEMLFYLLFYVAMKICHRHREVICSALMILIHFLIDLTISDSHHPLAFYNNNIIIEFIFGMTIGMMFRHGKIVFHTVHPLICLCVFSLALTVFRIFTFSYDESLYPRFVLFGVPATALILFVLYAEGTFQAVPEWARKLILIGGDISYPLYLVHIYFIAILSRLLKDLNFGYLEIFFIALSLGSLFSYALMNLFDAPVRKYIIRRLKNISRHSPPSTHYRQ
jgi:peptidoglycan/LPS O-acetylase OafA/YrhL